MTVKSLEETFKLFKKKSPDIRENSQETRLPGYQITEVIYKGNISEVLNAYDLKLKKKVIIKILSSEKAGPIHAARLRQDFEVRKHIRSTKIVKGLKFGFYKKRPFLVMENFQAISLDEYFKKYPFDLNIFFMIARKCVKAIQEIHSKNIIHKDIKPSNILINPFTKQVKITDFGISELSAHDQPSIFCSQSMEGTFAFISPEQTGRMNRVTDYRTDYYSLGITFYYLLTKKLPFDDKSSTSLIYSHLAKKPIPPCEAASLIPVSLSNIVLKLIEKNPEDRYQSSEGILFDLIKAYKQFKEEDFFTPFSLGTADFSEKFVIPEKLFGRKKEKEILLATLLRARNTNTEILMISGNSGSGKTALIHELTKEINEYTFISGKFDQFNKNESYSAIIHAFGNAVSQILTGEDSLINEYKELLLKAVGENGKIITDLIPKIKHIIGDQPKLKQIGATEERNRFNNTFKKFVQVFTQKAKPLVLFLDDIQWIDSASLGLIKSLVTNNDIENFVIIGAYRAEDVDKDHPFYHFLKQLRSEKYHLTEIETPLLTFKDTLELVSETLCTEKSNAYPLSELIYKKTGANPFIIKEFLKSLYNEGLIFFDSANKSWNWDLYKVQQKTLSTNILDIIIKRIGKLPGETLEILKKAACIGNKFSFAKLSAACDLPEKTLFSYLWEAVKEGIIIPIESSSPHEHETVLNSENDFTNRKPEIAFQHDRIQQAVYALISQEELPLIHLQIGNAILNKTSSGNFYENIFEIINHLNLGSSLITNKQELLRLAKLNYNAGLKQKNTSAYKRALAYFEKSQNILDCVSLDNEETQKFSKDLLKELAGIKYLCSDFKGSKKLLKIILKDTKNPIEKCEIYELLVLIYTMTSSYDKAISTGQKALSLFSSNLDPSKEPDLIPSIIHKLENITPKELLYLPEMKQPEIKAVMRIILRMQPPAFFHNYELYSFLLAKMIDFSISCGLCPESAKALASFGNIYAERTHNFKKAFEMGQLAISISKKFNSNKIETQSRFALVSFLMHNVTHIKHCENHIKTAYNKALEAGEIQFAGFLILNKIHNYFFRGISLAELEEEIPKRLSFCETTVNYTGIDGLTAALLCVLNLRKKTDSKTDFSNGLMLEKDYIENFKSHNSLFALFIFHVLKSECLFIYELYEEAHKEIKLAEEYLFCAFGTFPEMEFYVFKALINIALFEKASEKGQKKIIKDALNVIDILETRAKTAPENYLPRLYIVKAEFERIHNNNDGASRLYDDAIEAAEQFEFYNYSAISNEICARFWISQNKSKLSRPYYEDAVQAYKKWGASRKVHELKKAGHVASSYISDYRYITDDSNIPDFELDYSAALDRDSIAQTSQVIASEVDLEKLLKKIMKIMIESAGATKGYIILETQNGLKIEAEAKTESKKINILESVPLRENTEIPQSIVRYVMHTGEDILLNNTQKDKSFIKNFNPADNAAQSLLCTPLRYKDKTIGVLYLENNLSTDVFSHERLNVLKNLLPQAAISIDNARIFAETAKLTKRLEKEIEYREKVQKELEKSERKYREIFENIRDVYFEISIKGIILEVSPSVEEICGYVREELIGKKISKTFINKNHKKLLMETLIKTEFVDNFEAQCINKSGKPVHASINAMLIKNQLDQPERIIISIRDITEKKQLEMRLFHSQKMEAIGTLAGGIAHDFNNILAGISGYTEIALLKSKTEPEKIPYYLQGISKAGERAKNLVSQILSFSRSSETEIKTINPIPVIREALKLLRSSIPASIDIKQEINLSTEYITGNTTHIHQIIMNLCTNAAFSMIDKGGVLTVGVNIKEIKHQEIKTNQGTIRPGTYLQISVQDTGEGIPENIQKKIFDPYFTTKKPEHGTGLGLAMVQGIVENYSGYLHFESTLNKGTIFNVFFPVIHQEQNIQIDTSHQDIKKGKETIIFIDDEEVLVTIIKDLLEDFGYKVFATTNPVEALNAFSQSPDKFDLVISDMTMPVITGEKLCREILKIKPETPVIICTGYSEAIADSKLQNIGVRKKLTKPFNIDVLNKSIREIFDSPHIQPSCN